LELILGEGLECREHCSFDGSELLVPSPRIMHTTHHGRECVRELVHVNCAIQRLGRLPILEVAPELGCSTSHAIKTLHEDVNVGEEVAEA
jgi:hypothetical protein